MPSREEMISALKEAQVQPSVNPNREQMISELRAAHDLNPSLFDRAVEGTKSFIKGVGQAAVEQLPTIGAAVGGAAGAGISAAAAPLTGGASLLTVPEAGAAGAGLGAAAGSYLKNTIEGKPNLTAEATGEALKQGAYGVGGESVGQAIPAIAKEGGKLISKVAGKFANTPETLIPIYAERAAQINKLAGESGGSTADAADELKDAFAKSIDARRSELSKGIGEQLGATDAKINPNKAIEFLKQYKTQLDPDLQVDQAKEVDDLISKIRSKQDQDGLIFAPEGHKLKQILQEEATKAYRAPGTTGSLSAKGAEAAKGAAAIIRGEVNKAVPGVAKANDALAYFHEIEDGMNKSLIKQRAAENPLVTAGTGANERNLKALRELSDFTGTDMVSQAQNLAAMKYLGSPDFGSARGMVKTALDVNNKIPALLARPDVAQPYGNNLLGQGVMKGTAGVKSILTNSEPPGQQ